MVVSMFHFSYNCNLVIPVYVLILDLICECFLYSEINNNSFTYKQSFVFSLEAFTSITASIN